MNKTASFPVATNSTNTITLPDNKIYDVLFSPNDLQLIALDKKAFNQLNAIEEKLDGVASKLEECRADWESDDNTKMLAAQTEVRKQLMASANIKHPDDDDAKDISAIVTGDSFKEVVRFSKDGQAIAKYSLVPSEFFKELKDRTKDRKGPNVFFKLPVDAVKTAKNQVKKEQAEDTLSALRYTQDDEAGDSSKKAGKLNPDKVKEAFGKVKVSIKKEWDIVDVSTSGQIPSKFTRFIPGLHRFLNDDQFDMLDKWIAHINEDANISVHQYEKYQEDAVKELDKADLGGDEKSADKIFLPESWDKVKRLVKDTWGGKSALYLKIKDTYFDEVKNKSERKSIRDEIDNLALPSTIWDGSAGAQLMRYSAGASVKAEFDILAKGKLAIGAEAKFDAALAEAKAQGSLYFPDNNGHPLKPTIMVKRENLAFKPTSNTFELNESSPYFAVDSSLLTPSGASNILRSLQNWEEISEYVERDSTQKKHLYVQVVGHASSTGSSDYNHRLGLRRASVVADVFSMQHQQWLNHFKRDTWGEAELEFMILSNLLIDGKIKTDKKIDWNAIATINKKVALNVQLKALVPELERYRASLIPQLEETIFIIKEEWYTRRRSANPSIEAPYKIEEIIEHYTNNLRSYAKKDSGSHLNLHKIQLHSTPFISEGESDLKVDVPNEVFENRRCEFIAYELDAEKSTTVKAPTEIDLGHLRCQLEGHISAWAGANLQLGAQIAVAAPQGTLALMAMGKEYHATGNVGDAKYKAKAAAEAEAVAKAFAGAKAEAGLKASLDWKAPKAKFKPLGSIGYTVTALAGLGGTAEFKVGFDRESNRFVLKVHAEAALGPGIGGQLDIVVGVGQCYEFIKLVHGELDKHDYNFVDMFEQKGDESDLDVFSLFSAWSWKLFESGHLRSAGATLISGAVAAATVEILSSADRLLEKWSDEKTQKENTDELIEVLTSKPELIQYLSPETKGRILFDLIHAPVDYVEKLSNLVNLDINKNREEAAKILILNGVKSRRDWQETLEHLAEKKNNKFKPSVTPNASQEIKIQRTLDNENLLRQKLLDDEDDWNEINEFIQTLPIRK
jgi:outer membrane protein OmpA-like peptidoglycan-associated protein